MYYALCGELCRCTARTLAQKATATIIKIIIITIIIIIIFDEGKNAFTVVFTRVVVPYGRCAREYTTRSYYSSLYLRTYTHTYALQRVPYVERGIRISYVCACRGSDEVRVVYNNHGVGKRKARLCGRTA